MEKHQKNRNRMILERRVVGLAIVAAMNITNINNNTFTQSDIVSSAKAAAANFRGTTTTNGNFSASTPNKVGIGSTHLVSPNSYFLSSCNLCNKHLHGVDIFIYRGERAFCSAECRETHIREDDDYYQEKLRCGVNVMKPLDCSTPPCSAPHVSLAGIAAA